MIRTSQQCKNARKAKTFRKNKILVAEEQLAKYGRNFCEYCNRFVVKYPANLPFSMTADHKQSLKQGGSNRKENLAICCFECNVKKGSNCENT